MGVGGVGNGELLNLLKTGKSLLKQAHLSEAILSNSCTVTGRVNSYRQLSVKKDLQNYKKTYKDSTQRRKD